MSLLDRISQGWNRFVYGPSLTPAQQRQDAAGGLVYGGGRSTAVWPSYELDGQVARAYRLAVVQACVDAISRDVSAAPLRVYQEVDGQPEAQETHPARTVINEPNPSMSEAEFWYFVVSMAAVTGFCVIEKVRSGAGLPVQLWPLISPWLKVKPRSQALPDWEYKVPGNDPWPLAAEDVILITYRPDPWGGVTGRSPLSALKRELAIDDQMTDFLNLLLERGGVPPIGLSVKPQGSPPVVPVIEQAEAERIVNTFAAKYGGAANWSKPAFLGGLSVERIGLDLGELLYPQVREHIELHICTAFGVPAGMIGTGAGLARNTYSNAETDLRKYYDGTISPLWARLDGAFTRGLLREFDPGALLSMGFDLAEIAALQEDEAPKWDRAIRAWSAGMLTLNQAQAEVGMPGFGTDGEVLAIPFSATLTRPEDLLAEPEPMPSPPPPAGTPPTNENEAPQSDDTDTEGESTLSGAGAWQKRSDGRFGFAPEARATFHTRSKKQMVKLTRTGASRLRTFWRKQGERIADQATRSGEDLNWREVVHAAQAAYRAGHLASDLPEMMGRIYRDQRDLFAIDWDQEERELRQVLGQFHILNGETAFAGATQLLGTAIAWDLSNPRIRLLLEELGTRIVGIHETTRQDVARVVADSLEEGVSLPELSDRLRTMFTQTYRGRAMTVARTETQVAYNRSSQLAYAESGQVNEVELLDNPEHGDYDGDGDGLTCAQRNGMAVPLAEAQTHIMGTHPNCILAIAPILSTSLGED